MIPAKRIVRPLRGGQITIPVEFRKSLGIGPESVLEVSVVDGELRLKPLALTTTAAGSPWLNELYKLFGTVREEAKALGPDEVDAAIDSAVQAVRRKKT